MTVELRSLAEQALDEFFADKCVCGRRKRKQNSFCYRCYRALPVTMQRDLYRHMSDGYAEIYAEAKEWLRDEGRIGR